MKMSKETRSQSKPSSSEEEECVIADSQTGYYYTLLSNQYLTYVDIFANDVEEGNEIEYYTDNVAPLQSTGVVWSINAGTRVTTLEGTDEVQGLFTNFATREFSFHQWSHFEVCVPGESHVVSLRYHGVAREDQGNNQDIFGVVRVTFDEDDLVDHVFVSRFETIDRGY